MNYIFEISHKDKQLAASEKRRDFLVWKKIELEKKLKDIEFKLEKHPIRGLPEYQEIYTKIRTAMGLPKMKNDNTTVIRRDELVGKFNLATLFLNSVGDHVQPTEIQIRLSGIIEFYIKSEAKNLDKNTSIFTLEERQKFTPEYIEWVFSDLYREYPNLKQSPN